MAELLLKIDPGANYDDGDVLCAFNRRAIRCCHAQHICHPRIATRNGSGLIVPGSPAHVFFEATHQYRFNRVSATQVLRTDLVASDTEVLGLRPNAKGEQIDVRLFVARRKRKADHRLFGEDGAEVWYGGRKDFSNAKLDIVWTAIETQTPLREADHARWPMGRLDVRHHLPVRVEEFDDAVQATLVSQELDETDPENPVVIRKRRHRVDWQTALQLTTEDRDRVRDRNQTFDLRDTREFARASIVQQKGRVR